VQTAWSSLTDSLQHLLTLKPVELCADGLYPQASRDGTCLT